MPDPNRPEAKGEVRESAFGKHAPLAVAILYVVSIIAPLSVLYYLDPGLFEKTWIGRTFYLFFVWLVSLELILGWDDLKPKLNKLLSIRTVLFAVTLTLPLLYVVVANYFGGNLAIASYYRANNLPDFNAALMRLPIEYLVLTVFFAFSVFVAYGRHGLSGFSAPLVFLGMIGIFYAIDTLYPGGSFTPLQFFVPATANTAMSFLSFLGYKTSIIYYTDPFYGRMPYVAVQNQSGASAGFLIGWPCSGIDSFLIYAVVIALFLGRSRMKALFKIVYFCIGAVVIYFLNVLRIVTIYTVAIGNGDWQAVHGYYGPLFSIAWIACYPLIIIGIQSLGKVRSNRANQKGNSLQI